MPPETPRTPPSRPLAPRLIVVKIGSAVIAPGGRLDRPVLLDLAAQVARTRDAGVRIVVVSSGAVACGRSALALDVMPERIVQKQAAAAVGQAILIRAWDEALDPTRTAVAQVLLTAEDLDHRTRFLNARHTLEALLDAGIVPIVNENDSVSFEEIRLGDNDRLSALTALCVGADRLVILSTAPGLKDSSGAVVPVVGDVAAARAHITPDRSATGVGGMATKLDAAELAASAGVRVTIAPGREPGVLTRLLAGEAIGTDFPARAPTDGARKRWLGATTHPRGSITIDAGAALALTTRNASLLPKGITGVSGPFAQGAPIRIVSPDGREIARGLASYTSDEIAAIKGHKADQIQSILGYTYCDEVVHRDDLVLTPEGARP